MHFEADFVREDFGVQVNERIERKLLQGYPFSCGRLTFCPQFLIRSSVVWDRLFHPQQEGSSSSIHSINVLDSIR